MIALVEQRELFVAKRTIIRSLKARIEAYSIPEPNSGCWLWLARVSPNGYGSTNVDGRDTGAHRASYLAFNGPIPSGLHVLHRCDVPLCVNPDHLWLGTNADNVRDMVAKGRHRNAVLRTGQIVGATRIRSTGKWQVQRRGRYVGTFSTLPEAQAAYAAAE